MATKIVTKNSSTASAVPTASDLVQGELAVNVADKRLFTEDNAGAIVELGTNPSTLTVTGEITANGGIALGDGDVATFGDSDDLQIYHNGSDSFVSDVGTGDLYLQGSSNIYFRKGNGGEVFAHFADDGACKLRFDNSTKLATTSTGIDVTGTATMDGLTVNPTASAEISGAVSGNYILKLDNTHATSGNGLRIETPSTSSSEYSLVVKSNNGSNNNLVVSNNGDISFYEDTGTTAKLFWDASAESLGISTSDPKSSLEVKGTFGAPATSGSAAGFISRFSQTSGVGSLDFGFGDPYSWIQSRASNNYAINFDLALQPNGGNVGIGDSSPSVKLDVYQSTAGIGAVDFRHVNGNRILINPSYNYHDAYNHIFRGLNGTDTHMTIDNLGNVGIGTSTDTGKLNIYRSGGETQVKIRSDSNQSGNIYFTDATSGYSGSLSYNHTDNSMRFATNGTGEKMRIDSSGNLLVGKTSTTFGAVGVENRGDGRITSTRSGNTNLLLNRLSSDGDIVQFYKDGTAIGFIAVDNNNNMQIGGAVASHAGLEFGTNIIYPMSGGSTQDAACDLGYSSIRFKNIYRSGSTFSTSDRNMKQDIRDLTDAERNVALACKGLLKAFRFIDNVEKDGDNANIHFGVIAQELAEAFEAEGLDANHYQVYKSATYTDENDVEQTRLNVCYENLLAFIIAAI